MSGQGVMPAYLLQIRKAVGTEQNREGLLTVDRSSRPESLNQLAHEMICYERYYPPDERFQGRPLRSVNHSLRPGGLDRQIALGLNYSAGGHRNERFSGLSRPAPRSADQSGTSERVPRQMTVDACRLNWRIPSSILYALGKTITHQISLKGPEKFCYPFTVAPRLRSRHPRRSARQRC